MTPTRVRQLQGPAARLFFTSATILFVELFLIRWIPAKVVFVSFFTNFILMASFLGIGLGILLGRRGRRPAISPFPLLLLIVVVLVSGAQFDLFLASDDEVFFGLQEHIGSPDASFFVLPAAVVLTTVIMAVLALPLGPLLRAMPPLRAYAIDIGGSLMGIALFAALSGAGTPPHVWLLVLGILVAALALGSGLTRWSGLGAIAFGAAIIMASLQADGWSPYQRITAYQADERVFLNVNGIPHQDFPLDPERETGPFYRQVDRWFPGRAFDRVLVIGAGTGNDTYAALRRGATRVDAVEIDPLIMAMGRELNPARPFSDPRVVTHVDDGRAYLARDDRVYDLVVYALPDSLTLVSTTANIRLETFLFTNEALSAVKSRLAPDGIFVLYNYYRQPWLLEKLASMLEETFGHPPIARVFGDGAGVAAVLAVGPGIAALGDAGPPGDRVDELDLSSAPPPSTDDWPFLYLRSPAIAPYYVLAIGLMLLFAVLVVAAAARYTDTPLRRFSPHFFVLGMAFLLLETRSLVTFGLLFGNTWIVNAFVFFAILASVLTSIGVAATIRIRRVWIPYAGLFGALALAYLLPPGSLLIDPPWLRYLVASLIVFAPVFFANLCFSYSFRGTKSADMAFASNLLGAMAGGALEYVALVTGYQALVLALAVLYGLAYLLATSRRMLGDRDLERDELGRPVTVSEASAV